MELDSTSRGETYISVNLRDWLQRIEDNIKDVSKEIARSNAMLEAQGNRITVVETKVNSVPVVASAIGGAIGVVASVVAAIVGPFNK